MRTRRGAAALEFALIFPVYTMLMVGILDYGWLFYHRAALDSAASSGCRSGSLVDPGMNEADMTLVEQRAEASTLASLQTLGVDCGVGCKVDATPFGDNPARSLRCAARLDFSPLIGLYLDPLLMESLQVSRLEYQR